MPRCDTEATSIACRKQVVAELTVHQDKGYLRCIQYIAIATMHDVHHFLENYFGYGMRH
jgi:hypothetical protein